VSKSQSVVLRGIALCGLIASVSPLVGPVHAATLKRPRVTRILPVSGTTAGGTRVTIVGTGFTKVRYVRFASARGTKLTLLSADRLTVLAPRHATMGRVDVEVVTGHGSSAVTAAAHFTYVAGHRAPDLTPDGVLKIIAGTGNTGGVRPGPAVDSDLYQPGDVAVNPANGDVYVANAGDGTVDLVTPSGELSVVAGISGQAGLTTPGPATQTPLTRPMGVAFDTATGNLYVADQLNNDIDEITPSGTLSIIAGGGPGTPSTTAQPATGVDLSDPLSVAVDSATGTVYVANPGPSGGTDEGNGNVDAVTAAGQITVIAGPNPGGGAPAQRTPAEKAYLVYPDGLAVDPANHDVFVADGTGDRIYRITPSGGYSVYAGTTNPDFGNAPSTTPQRALGIGINGPAQLAFDPANGDLYIADSGFGRVDQVTPGGELGLVAGTPTNQGTALPPRRTGQPAIRVDVSGAQGLAVDPVTGEVFVSNMNTGLLEGITFPPPKP
jgi:DNA-binding beta-propeller fold protein YncE